jgi:thiamine pyrophosphokinase
MKRAIIFANGSMENPPPFINEILSSDLIIAADGGTLHCKTLGIRPNVIIGDFDSLESIDISFYQQAGVEILKYPTNKDETDLELALNYATKAEITQVYVIAALGNRWDMTVSNILLAAQNKYSQLSIHLLDGLDELVILRGNRRYDIQGEAGDTVSLVPIGGDAQGITTHGLVYPLTDETLSFGSSRGVSNVLISNQAQVSIREGIILLCLSNRSVENVSIH